MKSRQGFVSNSSTTSFSVFGVYIKNEENFLNTLLGPKKVTQTPGCTHELDREAVKFCPNCGAPAWIIDEEDWERADEYTKEIKEKYGNLIDIVHWQGGSDSEEGYYLGKSLRYWSQPISAAEKIKVLKEVLKKLKEIYPDEEPQFFSDGGDDR